MAFIFAVFKLYEPVRKFAAFYNNFQQALGASSSVFQFLDAEDEVKEKRRALGLPPFHQSIRFERVNFGYNGDEPRGAARYRSSKSVPAKCWRSSAPAVRARARWCICCRASSTSPAARILIDGHDVRDVTLASLRSQIGIVTQETILFNDTVRNNIAYGQPHVSKQQVVEAAPTPPWRTISSCAMPQGYDTIIGERGFRLSGGERQRLSIARALLKNAPILILDEATSALDSESENLVQQALHNLMVGRTVFVIAHRLSTVRRADRIVVLENGTISDIGTPRGFAHPAGDLPALVRVAVCRPGAGRSPNGSPAYGAP